MATPKTGTLTKIYMSEKEYPEEKDLDLIMYTETIPALEESAEAITYETVDMGYEEQAKGSKKSTTPEIPVLYHRGQHKKLKDIADSNESRYFFVRYPDTTCEEGEKPLVKSFSGQMDLTGDEISAGDIIKDTLTLYRNSKVKETYGLPVEPTESPKESPKEPEPTENE